MGPTCTPACIGGDGAPVGIIPDTIYSPASTTAPLTTGPRGGDIINTQRWRGMYKSPAVKLILERQK